MPRKQSTMRRRVLIVDDEESMRLLLASSLSAELDVEVQLAGTCEEALRLAGTHAYDAILLDLMMPGVGGRGVLSAVRGPGPNAATPIIIVSAVTEKHTIEACLAAGATAFVPKPVKPAALAKIVKRHLAAQTSKGSDGRGTNLQR